VEGDEDAVVDYGVTWTTPGRLCNLPYDGEDSVFVGDEPPNGITYPKRDQLRISNALKPLYTHWVWH